jgi:hypothetical protein
MRLARLALLALSLALVAAAISPAKQIDRDPRTSGPTRSVREFPAWKLLPTSNFATLTDRLVGSKRWALYLFKASPQGSGRRVCLQAINVSGAPRGVSVLTGRPECGLLKSERGFIASQSEVSGRSGIGTVTAIATVSRIEVELVPTGVSQHPTRVLNQHQMRKSGLPPLVYSAFVEGGSCLERLSGLDGDGRTIFSTGARGCGDG